MSFVHFQEQNGILLPSLRSALHFVDLHGVARAQFNQTVVEQLRDKLLQEVETLAATPNKVGSGQMLINYIIGQLDCDPCEGLGFRIPSLLLS